MTDSTTTDNPYQPPQSPLAHSDGEYANLSILTPRGRLGRMRFLVYSFAVGLAANVIMGILQAIFGVAAMDPDTMASGALPAGMMVVMLLVMIPMLIINLFITIKRLHDLNMSGWWVLLFLVPLLNVLFGLYLLFAPGTDGPNRFGPPPPPNSGAVNFFGWVLIVLYSLAFIGIVAAMVIPLMSGSGLQ